MKHKHADLIHAWADGAQIQQYKINLDEWHDVSPYPVWDERLHYRIKPTPKPDWCKYVCITTTCGHVASWQSCSPLDANLRLTFDGETGELKLAGVLK
jgi:hypothetical protein